MIYGSSIARLIEELARLPGVGQKSAQKMAFYILNAPNERAQALSKAITDAKQQLKYCMSCSNLTDSELCYICNNSTRDGSVIMVVESPQDVAAYEKVREYKGLYHVLHGAISPMDGIGPNELRIKELVTRVGANKAPIKEVIISTNPNVEGEATALYIAKLLSPLDVKTTRIAHGVPIGSDLEHVDPATLLRALEGRVELRT